MALQQQRIRIKAEEHLLSADVSSQNLGTPL